MGFDNDHLGTLMPFGAPSTPSFHRERGMGLTALNGRHGSKFDESER
jgi:hypothetical protein